MALSANLLQQMLRAGQQPRMNTKVFPAGGYWGKSAQRKPTSYSYSYPRRRRTANVTLA